MNKQIIQNACDSLEDMIEYAKFYLHDKKDAWSINYNYCVVIEHKVKKAKQSLQQLKELIKENK